MVIELGCEWGKNGGKIQLMIRVLALMGLLLYGSTPAAVKVFLLSGQSNMVGFGKISKILDSNSFQFSFPIIPRNPCTFLDCKTDTCVERFNFGPEVGIAKVLSAAYPKDKIILIKAAWSGKGLAPDCAEGR